MTHKKVQARALWAWAVAGFTAPAAQVLGSISWPLVLGIGLLVGIVWVVASKVTAEGWHGPKIVYAMEYVVLILTLTLWASLSSKCWTTNTAGQTIPVVLLILSACAAEGGIRAGSRCGRTLFWALTAMFLLLGAFSMPNVEYRWLKPNDNIDVGTTLWVFLLPLVTLLLPREDGAKLWPWPTVLVGTGFAVALLSPGVLSPQVSSVTDGAFFAMVRGISILGVAERFEAVVAAAMTLGWFCCLSLLLVAAGHMAGQIHPGWERRGVWIGAILASLGQWFGEIPMAWVAPYVAIFAWVVVPLLGCEKKSKKSENRD